MSRVAAISEGGIVEVSNKDTHQEESDDGDVGLGGLRRGDELLLEALARGLTEEASAAFGNVGVRTVQRRLTEKVFLEHLARRERQVAAELARSLVPSASRAVVVINEAMAEDQPPTVQLRAAGMALRFARDLRADLEADRRIEELEAKVHELLERLDRAGR